MMSLTHPTPLCHFVTSPPQGGRSFFFQMSRVSTANVPLAISPLEGKMPDRAEGGNASAPHSFLSSAQEVRHVPRS